MSFKSFKTCTELGEAFKESLKSINKKDQSVNGIPSGFKKLDVIINGFQPSNLILVGSVSGMGKTSFAVSLIKKMAIENKCCNFVTIITVITIINKNNCTTN